MYICTYTGCLHPTWRRSLWITCKYTYTYTDMCVYIQGVYILRGDAICGSRVAGRRRRRRGAGAGGGGGGGAFERGAGVVAA